MLGGECIANAVDWDWAADVGSTVTKRSVCWEDPLLAGRLEELCEVAADEAEAPEFSDERELELPEDEGLLALVVIEAIVDAGFREADPEIRGSYWRVVDGA